MRADTHTHAVDAPPRKYINIFSTMISCRRIKTVWAIFFFFFLCVSLNPINTAKTFSGGALTASRRLKNPNRPATHLGYCRGLGVIDYIISLSNVKQNYTNSPSLRQIEMCVIRDVVWRCPLLVNYLQH